MTEQMAISNHGGPTEDDEQFTIAEVRRLQSDRLDKFLPDFRKAQAKIGEAERTRTNDHFGQSYATLASVMAACKKQLNDSSISIIQRDITPDKAGNVAIETVLMHDSEQFLSCAAEVDPGRPGAQAYGSATTYLRRYTLATLAGVCPDDDDGESAEGRDSDLKPGRQPMQQRQAPRASGNAGDL